MLLPSRRARFARAIWSRRTAICFTTRSPQICSCRTGSTEPRDGGCDARRAEGIGRQHEADRFCGTVGRARTDQIGGLQRGTRLRVGIAAGRRLRFQTRHPRVCGCATRGRSSHRQLLSVRQTRLAYTVGLHPRVRRRRGRRSDSSAAARRSRGRGFGADLFSVDEDIDLNTWKSVAIEWFRGINSVLGVDHTGIYGHSRACAWAIRDGVIGRSTSAGHWWAWQTMAWSHGEREPRAVLYQAVVHTSESPGALIGGIHVDVDEVLATDFGQWDLDRCSVGCGA